MKHKKPTLIMPITDNTRASISSGRSREKMATAKVQPARINAHSSNEPS